MVLEINMTKIISLLIFARKRKDGYFYLTFQRVNYSPSHHPLLVALYKLKSKGELHR